MSGKYRILWINLVFKIFGLSGNGFVYYGDDDKFYIFYKGLLKDRGY